MQVVDTPGTNVILERQQRLTEEYVPRADLVLFVMSADRPLSESEVRDQGGGVRKTGQVGGAGQGRAGQDWTLRGQGGAVLSLGCCCPGTGLGMWADWQHHTDFTPASRKGFNRGLMAIPIFAAGPLGASCS
jgi:hypothetical protein